MILQIKRAKPSSRKLTSVDAAEIKRLLLEGEPIHRIAAKFDVNQGRISEIRTGRKFPEVEPEARTD